MPAVSRSFKWDKGGVQGREAFLVSKASMVLPCSQGLEESLFLLLMEFIIDCKEKDSQEK